MLSDFYVYIIFRLDGSPCYVGKGHGRRCYRHGPKSHNRQLRVIFERAQRELPVIKIREGLLESEAFEVERAIILALGRNRDGPLVNLTDGGDGAAGYVQPPSVRKKHGAALLGIKRSAATKRAISQGKLGRKLSPESLARRREKLTPDNWRIACDKISQSKLGRKLSIEHRLAIAAGHPKDYQHSVETRKKMSVAAKRREEQKRCLRSTNH